MPFSIIQNDLLEMRTDAIVNATDQYFSGRGGVDYAIHQAAGPELFEACGFLGRLHLGEAKATSGYNHPVKFILHTSGPHWRGGSSRELALLSDCYRNCIDLARVKKCKSVAFPLISSQGKHFPKEIALTIAINSILQALKMNDDIEVYLVVYGMHVKTLSENLFPEIQHIIEKDYKPNNDYVKDLIHPVVDESESMQSAQMLSKSIPGENIDKLIEELLDNPTQKNLDKIPVDENFAQMLARIMQERRLKHAQVYDELGMTHVGFWKLLKGKSNPSKMTVFGLAVFLKLSIEETKEMLQKAGYAINPSSLQDVIVAGLIRIKTYDRFVFDSLLHDLDLQVLPGAIID